ncbi:hypothetical protein HYN59_00575 [Flavobacterium album]|uniref:Secretion system C-terminal sorting domain-containing protein n=1 Tax=Flavobacterium album TaxID=2175091 RepID=A0A2S1QTQ3_9FLAO|nr:hypothetical protein [Flavobacterium album]AWH83699.1 hypothetical protein HYN59_00575 [Flavobacterium album]
MKRLTLKKDICRIGSVFFLVLANAANYAQVQNNGHLYIAQNASLYVASGAYNFGANPATTATFKSNSSYGKLLFASGAFVTGASNNHYTDGYAAYNGSDDFLFPVGDAGMYAPVQVTAGSAGTTDAAYYHADPATIGTSRSDELVALSSSEFWDVKGLSTGASVTLTWRTASAIAALTDNELNNLVVAGFNSTTSKWEVLSSFADYMSVLGNVSTFSIGSAMAGNVDLTVYRYFTFGAIEDGCAPLVASIGFAKTWDGSSWSPSAPTLQDPVVINGPYSGNLSCNSLELNANITLLDGEYLEIVHGCTGTGQVIMAGEASVVQRSTTATAPKITLTKTTRPKRRFDYVYWGTPIAEDFYSQLANAIAQGQSTAGAFDQKYKYVTGAGGGWQALTAITNGKGFITRVKQQAPFTDAVAQAEINLPITGVANNGDVTVTVANNPASPNGGTSYELLANPYPSAIDAAKFLRANTSLDGTLYFWTAASSNNGSANYAQADYAVWNLAGTVVTSPSSQLPTGKIASAQGFRVKALGNGTVTYTNCMRITNGNDNFFRMSAEDAQDRDRFKLTMTAANGVFSQIQIGYFEEATMGYDRLYDAGRNSVSTSQLYSFIDTQKLSINTRPAFEITDVVPLGVSKGTEDGGEFTISISQKEGIFNEGNIIVYLYDSAYGIYHDLSVQPYTFSVTDAAVNDRFFVVYQQPLGNDDLSRTAAMAYIKNGQLSVKANTDLQSVAVYDLAGRLIELYHHLEGTELTKAFNHEEAVYMAKITLSNGSVAGAKLINIK